MLGLIHDNLISQLLLNKHHPFHIMKTIHPDSINVKSGWQIVDTEPYIVITSRYLLINQSGDMLT